jgi:hypothetical protein
LAFAPVLAVIVFIITWRRRVRVRGTGQVPSTQRPPETQRESYAGTVSGEGAVKGPVPLGTPETRDPRPETRDGAWRPALSNVIALTLGCCAVIAPVTLRNRLVGGEWVLIGAYGGQNLWIANSPLSDGKNVPILMGDGVPKVSPVEPNDIWTQISLGNRIARYYAEAAIGRRLKFGEIDGYFGKIGREWILSHPKEFLKKTFRRFCFFLNAYEYPNEADIYWFREASRLIKCLSYIHFGVICPMAIVGLVLAVARRHWPAPLAYTTGLLASLWLPGLFFVINARFRIVIVPLLILFAAYGLVRLAGYCRRGVPWSHRAAAAAALAGLAVFSNINWFGYAEKYYTDHRLGYAVACSDAGREDMLPAAVKRFEEALTDDLRSGRLTQTAVMEHAHPIGWLFAYHFRHGHADGAFRYGSLMMQCEAEPIPFLVVAYLSTAIKTGHEKEARMALESVLKNRSAYDREQVVRCLVEFGEAYRDKDALIEAMRMLGNLIAENPSELRHHTLLNQVKTLLSVIAAIAPSTAAPASTMPQAPR